jgi:mono/diheme cytochrome c family protein
VKSELKIIFISVSALLITVVAGACAGDSDEANQFPIKTSGARITAGAVVYAENCVSCHGPVNGPTALDAAPVHGDAGHTWHHPDRLLFQWILDRPPLATVMPAFRGTLTDEQVIEVLAYIKSHWLPEIQDRQNEGSDQYEAQVVEFGTE